VWTQLWKGSPRQRLLQLVLVLERLLVVVVAVLVRLAAEAVLA
jgi:hypothetical protein